MSKQISIELIRQENMINEVIVNRNWIIETLKATNKNIEIVEFYDVLHNKFLHISKDAMYDDANVQCELDIDRSNFDKIIESNTEINDTELRMSITNGNEKQRISVLMQMDFHDNLYNCIKIMCADNNYLKNVVNALESTRANYEYSGLDLKRETEIRNGLLPSEAANKNALRNATKKWSGLAIFVVVLLVLLYLRSIV